MPEAPVTSRKPDRVLGRYALYGQLAAGGMATVHYGRLLGPVGFSRTVAIKRLHPQYAKDPEFAAMFLDEARVAARIQHPNVAATVDVVATEGELFLVMDYIRGETLSRLTRGARKKGIPVPLDIIGGIMAGALHGLHAAHEATDAHGKALDVVHRDVSPQNILVGADGVARVLDFGVAKAAARAQTTREGQMKGKLSYMAPEQLRGTGVDRRTDIFAAAVVFWEALTGKRLFTGNDAGEILGKILEQTIPPPSAFDATIPRKVDRVALQGLARKAEERFRTARDFAVAIEDAVPIASPRAVGEWVETIAGDTLSRRERIVAEIESVSSASEASELTDSDGGLLKTLDPRVTTAGAAEEDKTSKSALIRRSVVDQEDATTLYEKEAPVVAPGSPVNGGASSTARAPDEGTDVRRYRLSVTARRRRALAFVSGLASLLAVVAASALLYLDRNRTEGRRTPDGDAAPPIGERTDPTPDAAVTSAAIADVASLPMEAGGGRGTAEGSAPQPRRERKARPIAVAKLPRRPIPTPAGRAGARPSATPRAAVPDRCHPPFYFDSKGIRRIKRECL